MLVHSFLLVAFATLIVNGVHFSYIFPIVGIVISVIFYPLLRMQLKTAILWMEIEDEMENEMIKKEVFPTIEEISTAPNRRHKEMTRRSRWMWPTWVAGPIALVTVMLGVWIALLVIAC